MTGLNKLGGRTWVVTAAALIVLLVINAVLQPNFLEPSVVQSNLTTFLPLVLVAIGQTYVILGGDIDLSVGAIVALVNVVTVTVIAGLGGDGTAVVIGLVAGMGVGATCGLVNGLIIAGLRFQPIVTTFATSIVFSGLALWVLPQAGMPVPEPYWRTYAGSILGVPTVYVIYVVAFLIAAVLATRPFATRLKAVGGLRTAAFQTGLELGRLRVSAFMLSGLFGAFASLCLTGETASGDPLMGQTLAMSAISAVVLGGTALAGGVGGTLGSVLGAWVIGMIGSVIFFAGLPFEYQTLVQGLIILAALAGGVLVTRR
ncbi:ABC transporter permease [Pleomorphomonas sp. NRK KF1]|uniref:ABC transporter permease n=1 Tax=Pleomorphomonas sp. NRK KF1 TaxID=2943000 RepID=UPI0020442F65|nr:ABC transporter permease [Pleomorphomonas sp. NRK KF1]MCM5552116.1 ABC transporter permease [Pleomorphomonas sp. NRK KF1]